LTKLIQLMDSTFVFTQFSNIILSFDIRFINVPDYILKTNPLVFLLFTSEAVFNCVVTK